MNERIMDYAEQSGLYHRLATGSLYPSAMTAEECSIAYEKFAELIVRECAITAGLMEHRGRKNIGAAILDSFGVKE